MRRFPTASLLPGLSFLVLPLAAAAQAAQPAALHARPAAYAESTALTPGSVANIGISFDIDPEWHLYWNGLSDTGMPIQIHPGPLPDGYRWRPQIWPAPHRHLPAEDLLDHIYEHQVTIILPVEVPAEAPIGSSVTFSFKLDWLVCKEACILEQANVELTVPVARAAEPGPQALRFAKTRSTAPIMPPEGLEAAPPVTVSWATPLAPEIRYPGARLLEFYPSSESSRPANLSADGRVEGASIRIRIDPPEQPGQVLLEGVLRVEGAGVAGPQEPGGTYYWVSSRSTTGQPGGRAGDGDQTKSPASK